MHRKDEPDKSTKEQTQPHRPRFISDIKQTNRPTREFPSIGSTLSAYGSGQPPQFVKPSAAQVKNPIATDAVAKPNLQPSGNNLTQDKADKHGWFRRHISRKRFALILLVLIILVIGWVGGKFIINTLRIFKGNIFDALSTTKLQGEDSGRVNILLAGNSADDPGHEGASLTDSIMIISIDVKNNTGYMLSVPRDLWVNIPGNGHAKINEAYVDGDQQGFDQAGYFKGGMGLLQEVVQQNLGIKADYYALVNYDAFRDAVNSVGGIDITVKSVDPRGLYDPSIDYVTHGPLVRLTNGEHHLTGEEALDLSRARGDAYGSYGFPQSDFDRTNNQRDMLLALKSKVLSTSVIANPVKLGNLFDALGKNVQTNFTLGEARRLYDISKTINNSSIKSVSLNNVDGINLLSNYNTPAGQMALIPAAGIDDFTDIKNYIHRLDSNNPVLQEGAKVVLLNATDSYGVAAKAETLLTGEDVNVIAIGDAKSTSTTSSIINLAGNKKPATLQLLQRTYGNNVTSSNPYTGVYNADYIVIIGNDHVGSSTPQQ